MVKLWENMVQAAHYFVKTVVAPGDVVVDATAGNGHDTLFLAGLVGKEGKVYAFDIQEQALINTRNRLKQADMLERVQIIAAGHEEMARLVPGNIKAVMFNLGYLPGSDHRVISVPQTTIPALSAALSLLKPGGIVTVVAYPGHCGGLEEVKAVADYLFSLDPADWYILHIYQGNRQAQAPQLFFAKKRNGERNKRGDYALHENQTPASDY